MAEQEVETTEEPQDIEKALSALRKEREARKAAERRIKDVEASWELKVRYPGIDQDTWNDLQDLPVEKREVIASRLAAQNTAETPSPESEAKPKPEEAAFAAADAMKGSPSAPAAKLSLDDARKLSWPERRQAIVEGRVEGVAPPPGVQ
jgi:hypothetical protein